MVLFEETTFAGLIGGLFMPALNITAPAPVGPGFIKQLPSVKMACNCAVVPSYHLEAR